MQSLSPQNLDVQSSRPVLYSEKAEQMCPMVKLPQGTLGNKKADQAPKESASLVDKIGTPWIHTKRLPRRRMLKN